MCCDLARYLTRYLTRDKIWQSGAERADGDSQQAIFNPARPPPRLCTSYSSPLRLVIFLVSVSHQVKHQKIGSRRPYFSPSKGILRHPPFSKCAAWTGPTSHSSGLRVLTPETACARLTFERKVIARERPSLIGEQDQWAKKVVCAVPRHPEDHPLTKHSIADKKRSSITAVWYGFGVDPGQQTVRRNRNLRQGRRSGKWTGRGNQRGISDSRLLQRGGPLAKTSNISQIPKVSSPICLISLRIRI